MTTPLKGCSIAAANHNSHEAARPEAAATAAEACCQDRHVEIFPADNKVAKLQNLDGQATLSRGA